jgi:hypothetical protein
MGDVKAARTKVRRCRECGSDEVRRSQMRGFVERVVLRALGIRAYRCEACDRRYYSFQMKDEKIGTGTEKS